MSHAKLVDRFLSNLEWKWSLAAMVWGVPAAIASFVLPAWAVSATAKFDEFAPSSWVAAGLAGLLIVPTALLLAVAVHRKWVHVRYDARMLAQGGVVDPLEKTFERKRIYLNEFCLPSHPYIEGKAFIDCELIGPANIIFLSGNNISEARRPIVDAIYMKENASPNSGYVFKDCIFRGCNFSRVSFLIQHEETQMFRNFALVNWLTEPPNPQGELALQEGTSA